MDADDFIDEGRAALQAGAWERARDAFTSALGEAETAEGWEGLSWATWWLDEADSCLDARERAYRFHLDAGHVRGAARMAVWLSDDHVVFRGDTAVANGWLRRAERLLARLDPGPEHAWMVGFRAYTALGAADIETAKRLSIDAQELGRVHGVADVEALGLAVEGAALVDEGAVQEGMGRLDEAATSALAGECDQLAGMAYTCCLVISACDRVRDIDRAGQWCRKVEEFSNRMGIRFVHGSCRAYHASTLVWVGDWEAAESELHAAVGELIGSRPSWHQEAVARLAELRLRQGRLAEAEELFATVEFHRLARLGLVEIRLDRGELDGARALLERALRAVPPHNGLRRMRPVEQVRPLELMVRLELAAGDVDAARSRAGELREIVADVPIPWLLAVANSADGLVAVAAEDLEVARHRLEDAVELFAACGAPLETARARVELARVLRASGRSEAAEHEAVAAARCFEELGAAADRARVAQLLDQLGNRAAPAGAPLTARQREVLGLIAAGRTDGQIAAALVLSEHTVHRHVGNILARLGCSSRSAAVAEAARRGLFERHE